MVKRIRVEPISTFLERRRKGPIYPVAISGGFVHVSGLPPFDPESGELAVPGCPERLEEVFAVGTEPGPCSLHQSAFKRWWNKLFHRPRERSPN